MIIDLNNLPTEPDSDLDADISTAQICQIQPDSEALTSQDICVGDWVDVDENIGFHDEEWGLSFLVVGIYPNAVGILVRDPGTGLYGESQLSFPAITNVFTRRARNA